MMKKAEKKVPKISNIFDFLSFAGLGQKKTSKEIDV